MESEKLPVMSKIAPSTSKRAGSPHILPSVLLMTYLSSLEAARLAGPSAGLSAPTPPSMGSSPSRPARSLLGRRRWERLHLSTFPSCSSQRAEEHLPAPSFSRRAAKPTSACTEMLETAPRDARRSGRAGRNVTGMRDELAGLE